MGSLKHDRLDTRRFRVAFRHGKGEASEPMRVMDARQRGVPGVHVLINEDTGETFKWWPPPVKE